MKSMPQSPGQWTGGYFLKINVVTLEVSHSSVLNVSWVAKRRESNVDRNVFGKNVKVVWDLKIFYKSRVIWDVFCNRCVA